VEVWCDGVLALLLPADAVEMDRSGRALKIELGATDVDWSTSLHTLIAAVGRGECEGEMGAMGDGELGHEVGGVTDSRSVTTRMVKRGGMEMDGERRGEGGDE